ncbi:MAG TPA: branched-chain amino acid ABC transporter substrate-binding protein [Magnetospirillaceae bacterium]|jgi:branched-chain amino acid transport system substrate-binding protein
MKKLSVALLTGVALAAGGVSSAWADTTIAAAGPMTGELAQFGEQLKRGAQQAVDDINAKGGVNGQKLKLEIGDDACDPKQAVAVANKFASEGIKFVAGHFCSGSSIPASAVYADENIIQITPASTNPKFTEDAATKGWKNVFRTCGRDDAQGVVAGKYLAAKYKDKKVAILDDKSEYGAGLARETEKNFEAAGGKPVIVDHFTAGEKDYSALVGKLKAAGIDVVYIGGYHPEVGLIVRQSREQGYKEQVISADALVTDEFWKITGPAGEGTMMTFPPDPQSNPAAAAVVGEFKKANYNPEGYTMYSYAAVEMWAAAATAAKTSTDNKKIEAEIHGKSFDTVLGKIAINDKGDIVDPKYVFYIWHDGKYAEMK